MNHAVGTQPGSAQNRLTVEAPFLAFTGEYSKFHRYGKVSDLVNPAPASLFVFLDEDPLTIDDGTFITSWHSRLVSTTLLDYPASRHNFGAGFGFADGHAEIHRWIDPRTKAISALAAPMPNNIDVIWLSERMSAPVGR